MKTKLINLIRKTNVIIIRGPIGTGKSLLLTKLANIPEFRPSIYRGDLWQTNIFIDDPAFYLNSSSQINYRGQLWRWDALLALACCSQRKIFLTVRKVKDLRVEVQELADLIINTQEVSKDQRYLSVTIEHGEEKWKSKVLLTKDDFVYNEI